MISPKFLLVLVIIFLWECPVSNQERVKYTGYASYKFFPQTEKDVEIMRILHDKNPGVIFLKQPGGIKQSVDVLFPPHTQTDLMQNLKGIMPHELVTEDMESLMDHESHVMSLEALGEDEFPFDAYWDWDKCMAFNQFIVENNPGLCKLETYGHSEEGRPLKAIVVNDTTKGVGVNKPIIMVDSLTHSREWITVMSANYLLNELVSGKPEMNEILANFIVVIASMVNPDGFVYSWTTNRLWRKNRKSNSDIFCIGVDPNRNFGYGHSGPGSSLDKCSDVYCGTAPFSILETKFLKEYMEKLARTNVFASYMNLHSYSQMILLGRGCTSGPNTLKETKYPEFDKHLAMAQKGVLALRSVHGTNYTAGNSQNDLYEACGCSSDWFLKAFTVKGVAPVTYTFELRDTGTMGFVLPANQIRPNCEEFTAAVLAIHRSLHASMVQRKAAESETETILSEAE